MVTIRDIINSDLPCIRGAIASSDTIENLIFNSDFQLPDDYLEFLRLCNGGEGELSVDPYWFQIWSAEEVLGLNENYQVSKSIPGHFAFGSNGGGEMLVFAIREKSPLRVCMIPFIPMDTILLKTISPDFVSFAQLFGIEE